MISGAMDQAFTLKAARALWLALFYKCIDVFTNETNNNPEVRTTLVRFDTNSQGRVLHYNGAVIQDKDMFYEIFKGFQQNELITNEVLDLLEPELKKESEKSVTYDFAIVDVISGLIGLSAKDLAETDKEIQNEPDPVNRELLNRKKFNTNALTVLQQILSNNQASSEEKTLITEALWDIFNTLHYPEEGRHMTDDRFRDLLMQVFINSPYTASTERFNNNANAYFLDKYFYGIPEEYDAEMKKAAAEKKKAAAKKTTGSKTGKTTKKKKTE